MAAPSHHAKIILDRLLQGRDLKALIAELRPQLPEQKPLPRSIPARADSSRDVVAARRKLLEEQGISVKALSEQTEEISPSDLLGNIENFIGFARIPVGIIGPLRINGSNAIGDFYIPLATTEGALVASYNRGAKALSHAGGVTALCLTESVSRAPCFVFENLLEAGHFLAWITPRADSLQEIVSRTSRHCRLLDLKTSYLGKEVYLIFEFTTGDAAGQNMVTLATESICQEILAESPVKPKHFFLEGNMSGDKKASMLAFSFVRGKRVIAEAILPAALTREILHAEPSEMFRLWQISILGGIQSGSIGVQGHFANALAALFIACGQDAACVSEAAVGLTRMDLTDNGDLYVSVTLPNLIVGTVGGGTSLPTAQECLHMIGCSGSGHARKFAEICAATALAGEISITGALAAGHFARAHATLGRKPKLT